MKKTINYGLLMLVMLFSMASNIFADNKYGLKDNIQDGVILHCFDWTLADIQEEILISPRQALLPFRHLLFTKEQVKDPSGMMFIVHTTLR